MKNGGKWINHNKNIEKPKLKWIKDWKKKNKLEEPKPKTFTKFHVLPTPRWSSPWLGFSALSSEQIIHLRSSICGALLYMEKIFKNLHQIFTWEKFLNRLHHTERKTFSKNWIGTLQNMQWPRTVLHVELKTWLDKAWICPSTPPPPSLSF